MKMQVRVMKNVWDGMFMNYACFCMKWVLLHEVAIAKYAVKSLLRKNVTGAIWLKSNSRAYSILETKLARA